MIVYIVSSICAIRKIKEVESKIITRKFTWAEVKGKRYMLGVTAFYTLASAKRAKIGYLTKITKTPALRWIQPYLNEIIE